MDEAAPGPLVVAFTVAVPPARAFTVWTRRPALWWPASHTVSGDPAAIEMPPEVGGRVVERARTDHGSRRETRHEIGPGNVLAVTFTNKAAKEMMTRLTTKLKPVFSAGGLFFDFIFFPSLQLFQIFVQTIKASLPKFSIFLDPCLSLLHGFGL